MSEIRTTTKTTIRLEPKVTSEMLVELRRRLGESLTEFGETLQRAIPSRKRPFSRKYISALEHGRKPVTDKIRSAYYDIESKSRDIPAGTAGGIIVMITAHPGQVPEDGSAFLPRSAKTARCERPGCNVQFVKTHPRQKYHDPECK